ncbi:MAG: RNA polymerase sigma factor [Oscillospiraceae bacterium]|nr:RNA polymerase sigma factor [Oscillospiraceae bacterium]
MKQETATPSAAEAAFRRFCAGEQSAFNVVLEEFRQGLIYFLYGYVHNLDAAEDLAEDTFVELLVHPNRFHGQSLLKTYLFAVARHKAIDYVRREKRRGAMPLEELDKEYFGNDRPSVEEGFEALERAETLERAMRGLPEEQCEVLRLLYIERLSYEEIAAVMHKTKKQVDNLAYRARNVLREDLRKEGLFSEER